jgi:MFS family permease
VKRFFNGELAIIIVIMSLATMAMAILNPIIPLYLTSINVVPSVIGLMIAMGMVGMVFGETTGGWLADKIGLKIPMSVGTFLCAPLVLCFVFVRGVPALFPLFLFWGIIRAAIFGPARGYIGNTATLSNKATIIAVYMTSLTVSRSLGSLVSGIVADHVGYHGDFYISVGISVLAGILVITGLRKIPLWKPAVRTMVDPVAPLSPTSRPEVDYRPVIVQCVIAALFFLAIGVNSFLPLLATQVVGLDATQVGILYTVGGLVSTVLFIPLGRLADRKNKKALIMIGLLLSAAGLAGMAFAREYPLLILLVITNYVGFTMFTPAAVALLSNSVPAYWQSTAMGIYGAAEDMGIIIGSGVGGFVWTAGGPTAIYLMASTAGVAGALICLVFVKDRTAVKG